MPQFMDQALAEGLYRRRPDQGGNTSWLTYSREFYTPAQLDNLFGTRKDWLTGYGLDNNAQILVIGCGYGYLIEYLLDAGISDVWGIEPGALFWDPANDGEWRSDVKPRVANDWIGSGTEAASLSALPGVPNNERFGWIVDEDCITMHSDAELPAFIAACEDRLQGNAKSRIIHIVTTGELGNQAVNWKSLAEWKAVAPDDTWVEARTGTVA